ncbi:MAG TPA: enoyl-CoA hydratase-related protein, partial [Candidatus Binataceae bacterium]|nr:enoyl-CoA hydratase-related protein [Candidatus Binataceae bacterium]
MSESVVLVSIDNRLATVTLNRPEKLNALNAELRATFVHTMQQLRTNPDVGCVIITGAGRAFCAGLDLKELSTTQLRDTGTANFVSVIEDMEVPTIAAVNGFAVTGGFELALACDMMLAAESARFADTHARVGVMPGGGMTARLPAAVGIRK